MLSQSTIRAWIKPMPTLLILGMVLLLGTSCSDGILERSTADQKERTDHGSNKNKPSDNQIESNSGEIEAQNSDQTDQEVPEPLDTSCVTTGNWVSEQVIPNAKRDTHYRGEATTTATIEQTPEKIVREYRSTYKNATGIRAGITPEQGLDFNYNVKFEYTLATAEEKKGMEAAFSTPIPDCLFAVAKEIKMTYLGSLPNQAHYVISFPKGYPVATLFTGTLEPDQLMSEPFEFSDLSYDISQISPTGTQYYSRKGCRATLKVDLNEDGSTLNASDPTMHCMEKQHYLDIIDLHLNAAGNEISGFSRGTKDGAIFTLNK
jgi:hypothetical protein